MWRRARAIPAKLALARLLNRGEDIVPITGKKRQTCLRDNAAAVGMRLMLKNLADLARDVPAGAAGNR